MVENASLRFLLRTASGPSGSGGAAAPMRILVAEDNAVNRKVAVALIERPGMRSKPVAFLLADLSITKTHSRPYSSNVNPYSESQFRTMKYCPEFPGRFGCLEDTHDNTPSKHSTFPERARARVDEHQTRAAR